MKSKPKKIDFWKKRSKNDLDIVRTCPGKVISTWYHPSRVPSLSWRLAVPAADSEKVLTLCSLNTWVFHRCGRGQWKVSFHVFTTYCMVLSWIFLTMTVNSQREKQVRTNNDAAFQCNFLFNILLIFGWYLFPLICAIEFQLILLDFAIDPAVFTMWLQTYGWMDGQTEGQNNGQTDGIMGGQTNEWIDMQYMCIDMQKTMIFQ